MGKLFKVMAIHVARMAAAGGVCMTSSIARGAGRRAGDRRHLRESFRDTSLISIAPRTSHAFLGELRPPATGEADHRLRFAFRLAEDDGQAVGYVKLGPPSFPVKPRGRAMRTAPALRSKAAALGAGIAQSSWTGRSTRPRGAARRSCYLTVYTDNHRARRFYDRYGFEGSAARSSWSASMPIRTSSCELAL